MNISFAIPPVVKKTKKFSIMVLELNKKNDLDLEKLRNDFDKLIANKVELQLVSNFRRGLL